jgi:hypothetical protein
MKINNFRCDLTDNSAKKEAMVQTLVNALYHRGIKGGLQKAPTSLEELRKLRENIDIANVFERISLSR